MRRPSALLAVVAVVAAACQTTVSANVPTSTTAATTVPASTSTVPGTTATTGAPAPPRPVTVATVQLVDAVSGWGLTPAGRILRTFDGGRTWQAVGPEPASDSYAVADFYQDQAWVLYRPRDLLVLTEGGASSAWVQLDLPTDFEVTSVSFADGDHGWILANGPGGAGTIPVAVLRTDDGGHSWETVAAPPADDDNLPVERGHSEGLGVTASGRVWVTKSIGPRPEPWLAVSRDGGETWVERVVPVGTDRFCGTTAPHPDGVLFGALLVTCDDDSTWFAMTGDDGESWQVAQLPGPAVDLALFEDGAIAWGTRLYSTIEPPGGWETRWAFGSTAPSSLTMPDAVHGLAVVNGLLWWTGDGGDSWERLEPVLR